MQIALKPKKMPLCVTLETRISSVMESLTQAAVVEICKVINSECVEMRLEIRRGQKEIEALKGKIRDLQRAAQNTSLAATSLIEPQANLRHAGILHPAHAQCITLIFILISSLKNRALRFRVCAQLSCSKIETSALLLLLSVGLAQGRGQMCGTGWPCQP